MTSKQRIHPSWVAGIALFCAFGCGDGAGGPDGGGGSSAGSNSCSVTLSGAVSGTYDCSVVAAYVAATDTSGVILSVSQNGQLSAVISFEKKGRTGTFASSDPNAAGQLLWGSPQNGYAATAGSGGSMGSYSLNLSKVSSATEITSVGEKYEVDGTLDASLVAVPGSSASGSISLHATF